MWGSWEKVARDKHTLLGLSHQREELTVSENMENVVGDMG